MRDRQIFLERSTGHVWATGGPVSDRVSLGTVRKMIAPCSVTLQVIGLPTMGKPSGTDIAVQTDTLDGAWDVMAQEIAALYGVPVGFMP